MISGSGYDANPQNAIWFCHLCMASFVLPVGVRHECKSVRR